MTKIFVDDHDNLYNPVFRVTLRPFVIYCTIAIALGTAALTMIAVGPATAQASCDIPPHPTWTQPEAWAWEQLCAGDVADFSHGNIASDPDEADGSDERRVVSSAFIEQLLEEPYATAINRLGIRMNGAWLRDTLDLNDATTSFPVRCQNCRLSGLQAEGAVIDGDLDLRGSLIEGDTRLSGVEIVGNLMMADGAVVSGTLYADGLTVSENAFLSDGSKFADINLVGADIASQLIIDNGTVVSGTLYADGLTVGHTVFLRNGSKFTNIRLVGAHIGGDFSVRNASVVSGGLLAERLTVAGGLLLEGSRFADVRLIGAEVGSVMVLDGATWSPNSRLDLREAHVGGLSSDASIDSWPTVIALKGFTFDRWSYPDPDLVGSAWFTDTWLIRLEEFSPGPYNHLAAVMDTAGHPSIASDIRYSRSDIERRHVSWVRPERWGRELHRLVLGYGLHPWWALIWFTAAWSVGYVVLRIRLESDPLRLAHVDSGEVNSRRRSSIHRWARQIANIGRVLPVSASEWRPGQAAWYSLDRLLPAVKIADLDQFPTPTRAQAAWLKVQQLVGWVLTLFIVGWLSGLLVQT